MSHRVAGGLLMTGNNCGLPHNIDQNIKAFPGGPCQCQAPIESSYNFPAPGSALAQMTGIFPSTSTAIPGYPALAIPFPTDKGILP